MKIRIYIFFNSEKNENLAYQIFIIILIESYN